MTARVLRPALTLTTVMAILVAAIAVYAFLTAGTTHADSTYNPVSSVKFCNAMDATFAATDPALAGNPACSDAAGLATGAHPDVFNTLTYGNTDLNFSNVVTLWPNGQSIAAGGAIPAGTKIGALRSATTLGLINGACNTSLTVDFVLLNVALPNNVGAPRSSTNIVYPRPEGSVDRFGGWQVGSPPPALGGTAPINSGQGVATGASIMIQNYPSYLLDLFDPAFPGTSTSPLVPLAVYGGLTQVAGSWIPLYFAQFVSGGLVGLYSPFSTINANMGQPSVSVLNDPTAQVASPSSISDFCTPLGVQTMLLGAPGGVNRVTNPATSGTVMFQSYSASQRDTDQDGFENQIDTCPTIPDVGAGHADPRNPTNPNDTDGNGIYNTCEPGGGGGSSDVDGDGFANRQDNCPLVANPLQTESELTAAPPADNGPRLDGMGDACDTGTVSLTQNGQPVTITLSPTVSNGRYMVGDTIVAKCVGGTDADGDGYCTSGGNTTDNADSGSCASTVPPSCTTRHAQWTGATHPALQLDSDQDGVSDAVETYLGTDPTHSCAQSAAANNEAPLDNWPMDFNDDRLAGGQDVLGFGPNINKNVVSNPAVLQRFDLNADGQVTGADILKFGPVFNKRCGNVGAGATLGIPNWSQQ